MLVRYGMCFPLHLLRIDPSCDGCAQVERGVCLRRRRGTLRRGSTQISLCLLPGIYGWRDRGMLQNTLHVVRLTPPASVVSSDRNVLPAVSFVTNLQRPFEETSDQLLNLSHLCLTRSPGTQLALSQPTGDKSDAADGLCVWFAANRQACACFLLAQGK